MTRVIQQEQSGGNSVEEKRVEFAYDNLNRYLSITRYADLSGTDLVATSSYGYDGLGRTTRVTQQEQSGGNSVVDKRVDFTYDARGGDSAQGLRRQRR